MVNISNGAYIQWCIYPMVNNPMVNNPMVHISNGGNTQLSQTLELRIQVF